jgi:O-antigen ligase
MVKINRQVLIFVCALICLAGSLVAFFATLEQSNFYLRGYDYPLATLDLPYRVPRFGVNADLTQYTQEELVNQLDQMQALGVRWIRQIASWREIAVTSTQFNWQLWDTLTDTLQDYPDIQLIAVLVDAPDWATDNRHSDAWSTPLDLHDFSNFVQQFATRYGDVVDYYQVWDEPNIRLGWGNENPNPTHYFAMLQESYLAIHQADSSAHVIAAALAPTTEDGPQNISDITYLRSLYQLGIADYSDSIAGKPYGFDSPPDDRRVQPDVLNFSRIIALREVMVDYGDAQKMLWASAWGWNSQESIWGSVSPQQQIDYTLSALSRAENEWPWLGGMILREWQPSLAHVDDAAWGFALMDAQNQPTALYLALQTSPTISLNIATNGLYPATTNYATYFGTWTFNNLGADIGWVQDSRLDLNFYGQSVGLITRQDDYVTNLFVTVDDVPVNRLPTDLNNNAYLLLRSRSLSPLTETVTVASDLPLNVHHLQVTVDELIPDEPLHRWPIVGFAIGLEDLSTPYQRQLHISALATGISLLAVIISAIQIQWVQFRVWQPISQLSRFLFGLVTSIALMLGLFITWHEGYPQLFRREPVQLGLAIISAGILYWNTVGLPVALLAGGLLFLIIYNDIRIGVLLTILWTPFFLFPVELYRFAFPMVEVMVLITFAAWSLRTLAGNKSKPIVIHFITSDYIVIGLLLLGIIGYFASAQQGIALTDFRTLFVQPMMFYCVIRCSGFDRKTLIQMIIVLSISAVIVSMIGVYQLITGIYITAEDGIRRLVSVYGSPNNAALFLERVLPFVLAAALLFKGKIRVIVGVACLILMSALVLTQSAGALFLGIPTSIAVTIWLVYGKHSLKILVPLALLSGVLFLVAAQSPRFERLLDVTSGTNFYRIRAWQSSLNMLEDYPLSGIGLDQFLYEYRGVYILPDAWEEPNLSHPHNILLDFWLRFGILGVFYLIVTVGLLTICLYRLLNHYRQNTELFAVTVGLAGSLSTIVAHGLVDNSIFVIDLAYVFMMLLGMMAISQTKQVVDVTPEIMV